MRVGECVSGVKVVVGVNGQRVRERNGNRLNNAEVLGPSRVSISP